MGTVDTMDGRDLNHPQMAYSMVHYWVKLINYLYSQENIWEVKDSYQWSSSIA